MTDDIQLVATSPATLRDGPSDAPVLGGEYVVIPDGHVNSDKGNFRLDQAGADAIIAKFRRQGLELVVDYEHQTLGDEYASPSGQAPASGWIKNLRYEPRHGLVASVHWNVRAAEMIRTGEYKYLSPVMAIDGKTRRAVGLHSVALTNKPAIAHFPALMAASDRRFLIMADQPDDTGQSLETLIANLRTIMGMAEDATPEAVIKKAIELLQAMAASESEANSVREALTLPTGAADTEVVAAIAELRESRVSPRQFRALKERAIKAEVDMVVSKHSREGKLTAAENAHWRKKLTEDLNAFDANREHFEQLMTMRQPIVEPGQTVPPQKDAAPNGRAAIIAKAGREFGGEPDLAKLTNRVAFINLRLHEADLELLTDQERVNHG